jgi:hypothetical protein
MPWRGGFFFVPPDGTRNTSDVRTARPRNGYNSVEHCGYAQEVAPLWNLLLIGLSPTARSCRRLSVDRGCSPGRISATRATATWARATPCRWRGAPPACCPWRGMPAKAPPPTGRPAAGVRARPRSTWRGPWGYRPLVGGVAPRPWRPRPGGRHGLSQRHVAAARPGGAGSLRAGPSGSAQL